MALFDPDIFSQAELEAILATAKANLTDGLAVTSWGSEGTSVQKQFSLSTEIVIREVTIALKRKAPATYGYYITRTRVNF
jgi:hypothetical protein